ARFPGVARGGVQHPIRTEGDPSAVVVGGRGDAVDHRLGFAERQGTWRAGQDVTLDAILLLGGEVDVQVAAAHGYAQQTAPPASSDSVDRRDHARGAVLIELEDAPTVAFADERGAPMEGDRPGRFESAGENLYRWRGRSGGAGRIGRRNALADTVVRARRAR